MFDLDGTLVDSEPLYQRAWQEEAAALGFDLSDEQYLGLVGRPEVECERRLVEMLGAALPLERFRIGWKARWAGLVESGDLRAKSGAAALLRCLGEANVPVGLATSSERHYVDHSLRAAGLGNPFRAIATAEEVKNGKPAPDLFLLAAARLNLAPSACLAVEDSEAGAEAAWAAGMSVVWIPDLIEPGAHARERALLVAPDLAAAGPVILEALGVGRPS